MLDARDVVERLEELAPDLAAHAQRGAAGRGQPVNPPPSLAGFLDPASFDQAALLELVKQGIKRCGLKLQPPLGSRLDLLRDFVAMPLRSVEHGKDEELGAAFLQRPCGDVSR